jgi:hypothetical protein
MMSLGTVEAFDELTRQKRPALRVAGWVDLHIML